MPLEIFTAKVTPFSRQDEYPRALEKLILLQTYINTMARDLQLVADWALPEQWVDASLENSWVWFGSGTEPQYRKLGTHKVEMRGRLKDGTNPGTIFTLDAECRPAVIHTYPVANSGNQLGLITVNTDGTVDVDVQNNTVICIDGIIFNLD